MTMKTPTPHLPTLALLLLTTSAAANPQATVLQPQGNDWLTKATEGIRNDQRSFTEDNGTFTASFGNATALIDGNGLRAQRGLDVVQIRLQSWGRGGSERVVFPGAPDWSGCATGKRSTMADGSCVRRIATAYDGLTEYWQPSDHGLEQSWDIDVSPSSSGLLVLQLALTEASFWEVDANARGAAILGSDGAEWRYDGLEVWDAQGDPLDAWMEATQQGLALFVDDAGATYPLTIDPTLEQNTPLAAFDGQTHDLFGGRVSGAGDVNGDGFDDVLIGADGFFDRPGAAYLYLGSPTGIDINTAFKITASNAVPNDRFGLSLSEAGDINNDGYDDVIIGNDPNAFQDDPIRVYVFYGSSSGIDLSTEFQVFPSDPTGNNVFGGVVSGAGDLNGDGFSDIAVGGSLTASGGAVYLFFGSNGGIMLDSELKVSSPEGGGAFRFGYAVATAGDVNGDGYDDLLVGDPNSADVNGVTSGGAYLLMGSQTATTNLPATRILPSDGLSADEFGGSLSTAGDVNGDGFDDVLIGSYSDDGAGIHSGSAYLFYGAASGIDLASETKLIGSDALQYNLYGHAVSTAGDLNLDGYDDIIVGSPGSNTWTGAAFLYLGGPAGINTTETQRFGAIGGQTEDAFGVSVAHAGDVNGDGFPDVIIGASGNNSFTGAAYLFHGGCGGGGVTTWYLDADSDGYGDNNASTSACDPPDGYVADGDDCDDTNSAIYPGAVEVLGDNLDNNCDGEQGELPDDTTDKTRTPQPDSEGCGCSAVTAVPANGLAIGLLMLVLVRRRN